MILLSAFLDIYIQVKLVTIFTIFEGQTNSYLEWLHHLTLLELQKGFNVPAPHQHHYCPPFADAILVGMKL